MKFIENTDSIPQDLSVKDTITIERYNFIDLTFKQSIGCNLYRVFIEKIYTGELLVTI